MQETRSMVTENSKRIFFIFSISNQSQHTAADFYLSPYIILLYNLLIPKPKKVVTTLSKMVTGMRPIIAAVGKFIYSSKAKISLLKFQSFSNKFFAIPFNKPETTLHESPAKTEAVRMYRKVRFTPLLRFSFLRIKSHVNRKCRKRVQEHKISFSVEDSKLYAGKRNEQNIFNKRGNRPEQKQGGNHKNSVKEKRRF